MVDMPMRSLRQAPGEQRTPALDWDQMAAGVALVALVCLLMLAAVVA